MNKTDLILAFMEKTGYSKEIVKVVIEIFEHHFFFTEKGQQEILVEMQKTLSLPSKEVEELFEQAKKFLFFHLKEQMKHPFGSKH